MKSPKKNSMINIPLFQSSKLWTADFLKGLSMALALHLSVFLIFHISPRAVPKEVELNPSTLVEAFAAPMKRSHAMLIQEVIIPFSQSEISPTPKVIEQMEDWELLMVDLEPDFSSIEPSL